MIAATVIRYCGAPPMSEARILRIDPVERKIGLSIKEYLEMPDRGRGGGKEGAPRPEPTVHNPVLSEDISFTALGGEESDRGDS